MKCPMCAQQFAPRRVDQGFCSTKCSKTADTIELRRARQLYRALYWWRYDRKSAGQALNFICRSIRAWIEEDRDYQRGPPPKHDFMADRGFQRLTKAQRAFRAVQPVSKGGSCI